MDTHTVPLQWRPSLHVTITTRTLHKWQASIQFQSTVTYNCIGYFAVCPKLGDLAIKQQSTLAINKTVLQSTVVASGNTVVLTGFIATSHTHTSALMADEDF